MHHYMLGCTNAKSTINNRIASNRTMCECMCDLIFNHKSVVILPKSFIKWVFALWLWCVTIDFSFLLKNSFISTISMANQWAIPKDLLILDVHWAEYLAPIWKKNIQFSMQMLKTQQNSIERIKSAKQTQKVHSLIALSPSTTVNCK